MEEDPRIKMAKSAGEAIGKRARKHLEEDNSPEVVAAIDEYVKKHGPIKIPMPFAK